MGLPPGKNGGLSCFPHLVLRVHSAGSRVIAYQGEKSLAPTGFCVDKTCAQRLQMCGRIVEC